MFKDINEYQDVISSDDLKEYIELYDDEEKTEEEKKIIDEANRLINEYGDDFVLIRYSYAEEYLEDFVRDCYSIPKELDWLFYHIDWAGVLRDFTMGGDWMSDEFCGVEYYVEPR